MEQISQGHCEPNKGVSPVHNDIFLESQNGSYLFILEKHWAMIIVVDALSIISKQVFSKVKALTEYFHQSFTATCCHCLYLNDL